MIKELLINLKLISVLIGFFLLTLLYCDLSLAKSFKKTDLEKLIKTGNNGKPVKSLAELLPLLPDELLSNFTFVFDSRSPFKDSITAKKPRVILFSPDTRFILTFIGDEQKSGANIVEISEFNDEKSKFEFYAYDLNSYPRKPASLASSSCTKCHGTDPRPIYDAYPLWPGFYGAVLDSFPSKIVTSRAELKEFKSFIQNNSKEGLYKNLRFKKGSSVAPYLEPSKLKLDDRLQAVHRSTKFKPNEKFGISLTALNKKRIFRKIKQSPRYETKKKEVLFELLNCGFSKVKPQRIYKIKNEVLIENEARINRMKIVKQNKGNVLLQMQELKFTKQLAQLDWMAEQLAIDRKDWSLAMEENSLAFFDGILSGKFKGDLYYAKEDIIFELLQDISLSDKVYKKFFKIGSDLSVYDLPFVKKLSWTKATNSCNQLRKDILIKKLRKVATASD